ncbi:hypothetical protein Q8H44_10940, partial [Acinetobacter lwoffii]|uniref:hypothetical protein n=1 Tax=Acinetobacter lwoffii TaxID=28090 RepID=UPI00272F7DD6
TTYPSYALNLAQLGALCISNLCATKPICIKNQHNGFRIIIKKMQCIIKNQRLAAGKLKHKVRSIE